MTCQVSIHTRLLMYCMEKGAAAVLIESGAVVVDTATTTTIDVCIRKASSNVLAALFDVRGELLKQLTILRIHTR